MKDKFNFHKDTLGAHDNNFDGKINWIDADIEQTEIEESKNEYSKEDFCDYDDEESSY